MFYGPYFVSAEMYAEIGPVRMSAGPVSLFVYNCKGHCAFVSVPLFSSTLYKLQSSCAVVSNLGTRTALHTKRAYPQSDVFLY